MESRVRWRQRARGRWWLFGLGLIVALGALGGCASGGVSQETISENQPAQTQPLRESEVAEETNPQGKEDDQGSMAATSDQPVVFLGDSLTDYGPFEEEFADVDAQNLGISGNTTTDVLARLESAVTLHPSKLFLMIGINDLLRGASVAEVYDNIQEIVERIHEELPETQIVLQSLLPTAEPEVNAEVDELNGDLEQFAAQTDYLTYADIHSLYSTESGALQSDLTADGLHLLPEAYEPWFEKVRQEYL